MSALKMSDNNRHTGGRAEPDQARQEVLHHLQSYLVNLPEVEPGNQQRQNCSPCYGPLLYSGLLCQR